MLTEYFDTSGADEPIRIDIPKGGYIPRFTPQTAGQAPAPEQPVPSSSTQPRRYRVAGLVIHLLPRPDIPDAQLAVATVPSKPGAQTETGYKGDLPIVHVATIEEDPGAALPDEFSGVLLRDKLAHALSRFDEITVAKGEEPADYRLEGPIARDGARLFLNFHLVYQETGTVV